MSKKIQEAEFNGIIKIGNCEIPCSVLDDGTRLLRERSVAMALGKKGSGAYWQKKKEAKSAVLPEYVSTKNIVELISDDLKEKLLNPITYKTKGGRIVQGLPATLLPKICNIWLDARDKGALYKNQEATAQKAEILMRGLAHIGIIALVDEATGYQEVRDRIELQKILKAYISDALLPWTERFPLDFYKEMFRLRKWEFSQIEYKIKGPRGPRYAGKLTNELIYKKLPKGVLEELRHKNPVTKGRRKAKHHQLLTGDIGNPHLEKQIAVVTALMRIATDWRGFQRNFARAFPVGHQQKDLFPDTEDIPIG